MKAMILAAGLGTRLRPITDKIPKALVEVEGVPMLERVILSLKRQGFREITVNIHHFADQIISFLNERDYGVDINISDERDELLDTGGGIVRALPILFKHDDAPVLVHNVDILSNADLAKLLSGGRGNSKLLVSDRDSSRKLIFDEHMLLIGWHDLKTDQYRPYKPEPQKINKYQEYAFSGIYVMTKQAVEEMKKIMGEGKYSVMDYFLNEGRKELIEGIEDNELHLIDIGKPATLSQASKYIKK